MHLDLIEVCRLAKCRVVPVQIPKPAVDSWIPMADIANVAFEESYVDRIEANDRYKESHIHLCQVFAEIVRASRL